MPSPREVGSVRIREKGFDSDEERLDFYLNNPPPSQILNTAEKELVNLESVTGYNYKQLRILCKHDIFFLSYAILGYGDLSVNLHGHLAAWMMRNRNARFRMLLLPRSHYKTTIWTIADSIRIALPDDANLGIWPECLGPNCRILIGHEVRDSAATFLVSVAGHFLSNPLLMLLFPECVPSRKKHRINKYELELPRDEVWNEPTFATMGVGGRSQGMHYNYLKLDDLIGDKARDSKKEMKTAIDWIDNIQSFFIDFTRDHLDIAGTRWAPRDLYHHVEKNYEKKLIQYKRPAEEPKDITKPVSEDNPLVPIFPEKFTTEGFEVLKKNPIVWAAQYANNPEGVGREFAEHWKRFFRWTKPMERLIGLKSTDVYDFTESHQVKDLYSTILVDPAMSGNSGIIVTLGTGAKQFIVEAIKYPLKPPEFVELLFVLVLKWKPNVVAIEEVLFSGLYKPYLTAEMNIRKIYFNIQMYKVGTVAKEARIRGLASYFKAGKIYFHSSQEALIEEYDGVGSTSDFEDMHLMDALSAGPTIWPMRPFNRYELERYRQQEDEMFAEKDIMTGY